LADFQIETTKEMIGKASVQLEETMAMLQDKEVLISNFNYSHSTSELIELFLCSRTCKRSKPLTKHCAKSCVAKPTMRSFSILSAFTPRYHSTHAVYRKHKADELVAFAPQLQQCAAESGTLLQEYRVLHRHLKSEKAELKRVTQTAKIKQAQVGIQQSIKLFHFSTN
jgi:hypothetical protein